MPWVHAETLQPVAPMKAFPGLTEQPWQLMITEVPGLSMSETGEPAFSFDRRVIDDMPAEFAGIPAWIAHPTFMCINLVDSTIYYVAFPDGPDKMTLILRLMVPKDAAEKYFAGDPEIAAQVEQYAEGVPPFILEDNKICELQH